MVERSFQWWNEMDETAVSEAEAPTTICYLDTDVDSWCEPLTSGRVDLMLLANYNKLLHCITHQIQIKMLKCVFFLVQFT